MLSGMRLLVSGRRSGQLVRDTDGVGHADGNAADSAECKECWNGKWSLDEGNASKSC